MASDNAMVPEREPRERLTGRAVPPTSRSDAGSVEEMDPAAQERYLIAQGLTPEQARRLVRLRQRQIDERTAADRRMAFVKYMIERGLISDYTPSSRDRQHNSN
jgi:hypothetical protein